MAGIINKIIQFYLNLGSFDYSLLLDISVKSSTKDSTENIEMSVGGGLKNHF